MYRATLGEDPTDAPRVEELVKTFADAHREKVQEHLAVARAQKQLDRRARHDPKFLEQLLLGALKREASMAAAVGRAEAIFRAPPAEDGDGAGGFEAAAHTFCKTRLAILERAVEALSA